MPHGAYVHSGRVPVAAVLAGVVAGSVSGTLLGFLYAYVLAYTPLVGYLTAILAVAFGACVGAVAALAMKHMKARSDSVVSMAALVAGLLALWPTWAFWAQAISRRLGTSVDITGLLLHPGLLARVLAAINEVGPHVYAGVMQPRGTVLWVIWALECALVLAGSAFTAHAMLSAEVFCESCGAWARSMTDVARLLADPETVRANLDSNGLEWIAGVKPPRSSEPDYVRIDLRECATCDFAAMTVLQVQERGDDNGKLRRHTSPIVAGLLVDPAEVRAIRSLPRPE